MRRRNTLSQDDRNHREMLLRPPDKTWKENLRDLFWDPKKKTCLTRTPLNWCSITLYYLIFVAFILSTFIIAMLIVYYKLNVSRPNYLLNESPIGSTPCLNFFPLHDSNPLIWLSSEVPYENYVNAINQVFENYREARIDINTSNFGECADPPFGYDTSTPCIFFRLNRLLFWKPTPYRSEDEIPHHVPESIKNLIANSSTPRIWVHCQGTTPKDRDHLDQSLFQFQGPKGFDISVYPFKMQRKFPDPIIALKLNGTFAKNVVHSVTCSAWSKNLIARKSRVEIILYKE